MASSRLTDQERAFVDALPVARLATADASGAPHVLPICFVVLDDTLYLTVDQKPKSGDPRSLKRLRNIAENPQAAVIVDRYAADWSQLGWVMLRGAAAIIESGAGHGQAQAALKAKYPQYLDMELTAMPVIAMRIERVASWGNLSLGAAR